MIDRRQTWMSAVMALAIGGCAAPGNTEKLEAQLRQQEDMLADVEKELASVRNELKVARNEVEAQRDQLQVAGHQTLVAEQAEVLYRAEAIKFNALLTCGVDRDGHPGDEEISVLLMPTDAEGELIKLAGTIDLELHDFSKPENEQCIGKWSFNPTEAREHWHRGFMAAGYLFKLPWQTPPGSNELTLHGKMKAPDGRTFAATQQLKVHVPGQPSAAVAEAEPAAPERRVSKYRSTPSEAPLLPPAEDPVKELKTGIRAVPRKPDALRKPDAHRKPDDGRGFEEQPAPDAEAPPREAANRNAPLRTVDSFTDADIPRLR